MALGRMRARRRDSMKLWLMGSIVSQMHDVAGRNGEQLASTVGLNQNASGFVQTDTVAGHLLIARHDGSHTATNRTTPLGNFLAKPAGDSITHPSRSHQHETATGNSNVQQ